MEINRSLIVILFSLLAVVSVVRGRATNLVGDYRPIKNLNDPHVVETAKYAVAEHNKEAGTNLEFVKILKGESQVVAGINYRLVISTNDNHNYEAVVYENLSSSRTLISFTPLPEIIP